MNPEQDKALYRELRKLGIFSQVMGVISCAWLLYWIVNLAFIAGPTADGIPVTFYVFALVLVPPPLIIIGRIISRNCSIRLQRFSSSVERN